MYRERDRVEREKGRGMDRERKKSWHKERRAKESKGLRKQ